MIRYAAAFFILASLAVPFTGAVAVEGTRQPGLIGAAQDLNVTGTDIENQTFPSQYNLPPALMEVRVRVSDTILPGPKGEMATGPRSIGLTADPAGLLILVVAIITVSAGIWFLVRQKPEEDGEEDNNKGEGK